MSRMLASLTSCCRAQKTPGSIKIPNSLTFVFHEPCEEFPITRMELVRRQTRVQKLRTWANVKKNNFIKKVTGPEQLTTKNTVISGPLNLELPNKPIIAYENKSYQLIVPACPPTLTMPNSSMPILTREGLRTAKSSLKAIVPLRPVVSCSSNIKETEQEVPMKNCVPDGNKSDDEGRVDVGRSINFWNNFNFATANSVAMLKRNLTAATESALTSLDSNLISYESGIFNPINDDSLITEATRDQVVAATEVVHEEMFASLVYTSLEEREAIEWLMTDQDIPSLTASEASQITVIEAPAYRDAHMRTIETIRRNRDLFGLEDIPLKVSATGDNNNV